MAVIASKIDFKKPRQKMWGIIENNNLVSLPYGGETDSKGNLISDYTTNCYEDALEQAKLLLSQGITSQNVQVVEFVPYDYIMQPRV